MNAVRYVASLPFLKRCYPRGHRLQHDNDPKHISKYIGRFFATEINLWKTPTKSPDINPIENVWGSLKQFLRSSYKPSKLEELKEGI